MKPLNPIIEALDGIDEDIALAAATKKRKIKKPLKIVIISVAAALLLTTTATAATLGEKPLVKLNRKSYSSSKCWSYTDENGWTLKTTVIKLPEECSSYGLYGYVPVGEIRPVFTENADSFEFKYYDELGVLLNGSHGVFTGHFIVCGAEKPGEIPLTEMSLHDLAWRYNSMTIKTDGTICVDVWQDPIQAGQEAYSDWLIKHMSLDERVEAVLWNAWDFGLPDFSGFKHPSLREILANEYNHYAANELVIGFEGSPSAAARQFYDYSLEIPEGFTEKDDIQAITYADHNAKLITQQMFIYTVTDDISGKDVKFTVWRSAEAKDTYTDHFGFEYEYITLNNGTKARLHQSGYTYIVEFEKDGAAYAFQADIDRELIERVLQSMELLQ